MNAPTGRLPVLGVSALVVEEDQLLLVRRERDPARGMWALPGGHVEMGETLAEAVVREVAEETGLEGVAGELVGLAELIDGGFHAVVLSFRVHLMEYAVPQAADDAVEASWVPLGDVAEHALVGGLGEFLHDHGVIATYC